MEYSISDSGKHHNLNVYFWIMSILRILWSNLNTIRASDMWLAATWQQTAVCKSPRCKLCFQHISVFAIWFYMLSLRQHWVMMETRWPQMKCSVPSPPPPPPTVSLWGRQLWSYGLLLFWSSSNAEQCSQMRTVCRRHQVGHPRSDELADRLKTCWE